MNREHKDKPNVYIQGNKIVIQCNDQDISLNMSQTQTLVQELIEAQQALGELEEKKKHRIEGLRARREECADDVDVHAQKDHIQRWNEGILHAAPSSVLASCFSIDDDGWARVHPDLTKYGRIGFLFSLSTHEEIDILSELWSWGAFDERLCAAVWDIPSEQIPQTFQPRLIPFVSQECFIPAGPFSMGFEEMDALPCEYPKRIVTLSRDIYVTRFPITQLQYLVLTNKKPAHFQGGLRPVESISWFDAIEACNLYSLAMGYTPAYHLNKDGTVRWDRDSNGYRLPTEAEWEASARADQSCIFSGGDDPHQVAWFAENSEGCTHQVGSKEPNNAHLYDMTGNVWEWVFDAYNEEAYRHTPTSDPVVEKGIYRVCRGGAFTSSDESMRISIRGAYEPEERNWALGFRMVRYA